MEGVAPHFSGWPDVFVPCPVRGNLLGCMLVLVYGETNGSRRWLREAPQAGQALLKARIPGLG